MSNDLDVSKVRDLFILCKEFQVSHLKVRDLAVQFAQPPRTTLEPLSSEAAQGLLGADKMPTEDEMLYWSVPGVEFPIKAEAPQ